MKHCLFFSIVYTKSLLTSGAILILVVLVGLVVIFKKQLTSLVNKAFTNINNKAGSL